MRKSKVWNNMRVSIWWVDEEKVFFFLEALFYPSFHITHSFVFHVIHLSIHMTHRSLSFLTQSKWRLNHKTQVMVILCPREVELCCARLLWIKLWFNPRPPRWSLRTVQQRKPFFSQYSFSFFHQYSLELRADDFHKSYSKQELNDKLK